MYHTNAIVAAFVLIPLLGFMISLFIPSKKEKLLSSFSFFTILLQFIFVFGFTVYWLSGPHEIINVPEFYLYKGDQYTFLIDFYFDKISAVYLFTGSFITLVITRFSSYYMHMEPGFKRFFNVLLLFFLGFNLTIVSGNFETLFIGWEILGISSFLLIAFYHERYLPVRNAVKVFSIYRIGDVFVILAMWASHHLWFANVSFADLRNYDLVQHQINAHSNLGLFISISLFVAAAAKSAQFPFSAWLPRAMEGPTPSSAIFYGSLSVHFGTFLLLRTFPFWEHQWTARILIGMVGLISMFSGYFIARVQSNVKAQIAYASIAQIGIMFIEISMGWHNLALFHFVGNAFLRTYQLLVSPSIVAFKIRDQFYHFVPTEEPKGDSFLQKVQNSIFLFSIREWNLDKLVYRLFFGPMKKLGSILARIRPEIFLTMLVFAFVFGLGSLYKLLPITFGVRKWLPEIFSFFAFLMVMRAFSERQSPLLSWLFVVLYHFWVVLSVSFNELYSRSENFLYLSGIVSSGIIGFVCLLYLKRRESRFVNLGRYHGHIYEYPRLALLYFLASLGLMGFPITSTFIGEDLIFSHIHETQVLLALFNALSFIVGGIVLIRLYARIFLGPHVKSYHSTAPVSS